VARVMVIENGRATARPFDQTISSYVMNRY